MAKPERSIFDTPNDEQDARRLAEALADIETGRVVPHEEVRAWLKTWGTPDEKPAPNHWFKR